MSVVMRAEVTDPPALFRMFLMDIFYSIAYNRCCTVSGTAGQPEDFLLCMRISSKCSPPPRTEWRNLLVDGGYMLLVLDMVENEAKRD